MSEPLVSIIMPVHNAGKYFSSCVESILNQTLRDIELIMVLDKPTDGTDTLAYEFAKKDERIKILQNVQNLHIGYTRNKGLSIAKGKYIAFSDHDDVREPDMYESLYNFAEENNTDILYTRPTMKYSDRIVRWDFLGNEKNLKSFIMSDLIGFGNYYRSCPNFCFLHFNLYKRNIIEKNNIKFVDTRYITPEDVIFNLECIYHANNVNYIDKTFYFHVEYLESTGRSLGYSSCKPRLEGMSYIYNFLIKNNIYEQFRPQFELYVKKEVLNSIVRSSGKLYNFKAIRSNLLLFKRYDFVRDAFSNYLTMGYPAKLYKNLIRFVVSIYLSR